MVKTGCGNHCPAVHNHETPMRHLNPNKKSELALSLKILIPTGLMFLLFVYFSYFDAVDMVNRSGEGFADYLWQWQDDPSRIVAKFSYLKLYQPWGWVLGNGLYVEDVHTGIAALTRKLLWLLMGVVVVSLVFCFYVFQHPLAVDGKRRRAERINTVLIRTSNAVNTTFDLEALYPSIHQSLGEIINVPNFLIALVDRDTGSIAFPYYQDEMDGDYPVIQDIHRSGSLTARVIHKRSVLMSWWRRAG
jgi:hypothetical protein